MEKRKKPEHDEEYWIEQRRSYIKKNKIILDSYPSWEWICPYDFWRIIFPEGCLQKAGEEIPWDEPGGGYPNGIMLQITNRKRHVKTKTGLDREVPYIERYTLTDDLDGVEERIRESLEKNEAVFCSPVSFFGKSRNAKNARFLHAFAVDLDGVDAEKLGNLLKQIGNSHNPNLPGWTSIPQPTFLVNSGTGFHLYYVLERPVPLMPKMVPFLQELKAKITDYIWRDTVSTLEDVQHQGIYQAFRMPGTTTKLNGATEDSKIKDKYEVVAFVHNGNDGKPFLWTIDALVDAVGARHSKQQMDELLELVENGGKTPIERAKKLWPDWYQKRIIDGEKPGRWVNSPALYEWWIGQIRAHATDHHRYWCLNVLAAYAQKCGVPYERLEEDALSLVPFLETLTEREDNHFTEEHALAAIDAYFDPIIHKLTRKRIERRTAIDLPKNKRNGRSQKQHIEVMNAVREIDHPNGSWRNKDGAPTKADIVRDYALAHPDANHSEIARALGVSRPTVIKWLKSDETMRTANAEDGYTDERVGDLIREYFANEDEIWRQLYPNFEWEKRERETVKSSGTAVKLSDVSRETFPIDDRLTNGHNEA